MSRLALHSRGAVVALALAALVAFASIAHAESLRAIAEHRTSPIVIDGHLDEPAWQHAPRQHGFTQRFPNDGGPAQLDTAFAVVYDNDAIYVAVWADDPDPEHVRRLLTRRDVDSPSDGVVIGIDSYHDRRTAYAFQLNAAGVDSATLYDRVRRHQPRF